MLARDKGIAMPEGWAIDQNGHPTTDPNLVGAALIDDTGTLHTGCNVENASYGLTCCAERTALFSAITAGHQAGSMTAIVIYVPGDSAFTACGACRQIISELMPPEAPVISICDGSDRIDWTVAECLPSPFSM